MLDSDIPEISSIRFSLAIRYVTVILQCLRKGLLSYPTFLAS